MIGIYKITSPIGRIYIGQSIEIENRLHRYSLGYCNAQPKLCRSITKYGWENHIFEILEICLENELNSKERYYQEYYNVLVNGLNCILTSTKDKSGKMSLESRLKLKQSLTGRKLSKNHCINISKALRKRIVTQETKDKIGYSQKGKPRNPASIQKMTITRRSQKLISPKRVAIVQLTIDDKYINTFSSITDCSKKLGICRPNIIKVLKNKRNTVGGYKFITLAQYKSRELLEKHLNMSISSQVSQ